MKFKVGDYVKIDHVSDYLEPIGFNKEDIFTVSEIVTEIEGSKFWKGCLYRLKSVNYDVPAVFQDTNGAIVEYAGKKDISFCPIPELAKYRINNAI